ncbi:hypothetical protein GX441_10970 [bacterium]|nr:hypothetical protein [bacterium]
MNQEMNFDERKRVRFEATIDILYLLNLTFLYVYSVVSPIFGIIIAIILKSGSLSERAKKVGNTCLIISLICLGVWVVLFILIIVIAALVGTMAGL